MLVLTFRVGAEPVGLDIRRVREVVPRVCLQPVSGAPAWLAGVFVYRGQVVPVIDLYRLVGGPECPPHLSSRIILVPYDGPDGGEQLVGLLASQVADIREVAGGARPLANPTTAGRANLGPIVADPEGVLRLLEPDRLLPGTAWQQLLARPAEAPS